MVRVLVVESFKPVLHVFDACVCVCVYAHARLKNESPR